MSRLSSISGLLLLAWGLPAVAEVNRVVILKVDGLPEGLVERYVAEKADGARTGHSRLPWIEHVFAKNGTWLDHFYVRGISLSAPSWSMLDTGRHLEIRGNDEYDRYTLRSFDYLNFFPFYVAYAQNKRADMRGVEILDEQHVPLLIDRFPPDQRFQSFQLFQRGVRWQTLKSSMTGKFSGRGIKDIFDEWQTGFSMGSSVYDQTERELLEKLKDPNVHYLDFYTGDADHAGHLTNDPVVMRHVVESLDALVGRIWAGIAESPLASTTVLVLVSDHGMNNEPGVFSQGYNLIDWFNSAAGGGHHVLTNRHPMTEFKLRGLDPFVSEVISPSSESAYLAGESARYPTAVMDLDGNERASISLRNDSLNQIQILLDQLIHKKLPGPIRHATLDALFQILDGVRPVWAQNVIELGDQLRELRALIAIREKDLASKKVERTKIERDRLLQQLDASRAEERTYSAYVETMKRLLSLDPADFDPGKFNIEDLIPRRSLGEPNSIAELRHYTVGLGPSGLVLADDGSLDRERSFRHIDYFSSLAALSVRNNVQKAVGSHPVDFIAALETAQSIRLFRDAEHQAVIETRRNAAGVLEIRYVPEGEWRAGLPLELFEDPLLHASREWLKGWHTEREWFAAVYQTRYSNGIVGLTEQMLAEPSPYPYLETKRRLRRADMLVFANDHWNFNVRGFNPGGNHGSLFGISTHSVLMLAGGDQTGVPRGLRVQTPYDSLSLVPTILTLMGRPEPDLPGPVIQEVLTSPATSDGRTPAPAAAPLR